jgi:hypothetical protein
VINLKAATANSPGFGGTFGSAFTLIAFGAFGRTEYFREPEMKDGGDCQP